MKTAGWTLRPPFSPLCPPTAWMLSAKVWMWTWPTRNGLIALTRQVMCTHWSGSCCFNKGNGRVHHLVYNTFTQIYIYIISCFMHYVKISSVPTNVVAIAQVFFFTHTNLLHIFRWVSVSFCFSSYIKWFLPDFHSMDRALCISEHKPQLALIYHLQHTEQMHCSVHTFTLSCVSLIPINKVSHINMEKDIDKWTTMPCKAPCVSVLRSEQSFLSSLVIIKSQ